MLSHSFHLSTKVSKYEFMLALLHHHHQEKELEEPASSLVFTPYLAVACGASPQKELGQGHMRA
jgi:hypothetical protein